MRLLYKVQFSLFRHVAKNFCEDLPINLSHSEPPPPHDWLLPMHFGEKFTILYFDWNNNAPHDSPAFCADHTRRHPFYINHKLLLCYLSVDCLVLLFMLHNKSWNFTRFCLKEKQLLFIILHDAALWNYIFCFAKAVAQVWFHPHLRFESRLCGLCISVMSSTDPYLQRPDEPM